MLKILRGVEGFMRGDSKVSGESTYGKGYNLSEGICQNLGYWGIPSSPPTPTWVNPARS